MTTTWKKPNATERKKHMGKLAVAFCRELEAGGISEKRPFGNSDVGSDVAEICGFDKSFANTDDYDADERANRPVLDYAYKLWDDLPRWLSAAARKAAR